METNRAGLLIAVEGIDGAGKTTLVGSLFDFFVASDVPVVRSKEPTEGPWGQILRETTAGKRMTWSDELLALTEDRREHVAKVIRPAIEAGKVVILDRYFYSSAAYQGSRGEGDPETILAGQTEFAPTPDVTFLIDVEPSIGLSRIRNGRAETPNSFERLDTLTRAREVFLELERNHATVIHIDGRRGIEEVRQDALRFLLAGVLKERFCGKAYGCDDPVYCAPRIDGTCRWVNMWRTGRVEPIDG